MQPLVLKSLNSVGNTDYFDGLAPDIELQEDFGNLGMLGDPNEPLLRACLNDISVNGSIFQPTSIKSATSNLEFMGSNQLKPMGDDMWKEDVTLPVN